MNGRFSKMWFRVYNIIEEARGRVVGVVEEICRELSEVLKDELDELARELNFKYSIEVKVSDGDLGAIVPCLYIEGSRRALEEVRRRLHEKYGELVSDARLVIELKPRELLELL